MGRRAETRPKSVADEGPGIPADRREEVWRPFVRLEDEASMSATGCGIGLAIVSELVALHGGRRSIQSRDGRGSLFVIDLPAIDDGNMPDGDARRRAHRTTTLGAGVS